MLLKKPVTADDLLKARRLIRQSGLRTEPHGPLVDSAPQQQVQPAAAPGPESASKGHAMDAITRAWKKTVWSETAFEPRN